jgi:hypothetical protein
MGSIEYRVRLSPEQIRDRLSAERGKLFAGTIRTTGFSVRQRRNISDKTGRIMNGSVDAVDATTSVIHITFRASRWTRFTIETYFTLAILMQFIFLFVLLIGIRDRSLLHIFAGIFPLLLGIIGYIYLRSGRWTDLSSEQELLRSLDTVLGNETISFRRDG